MDRQLDAAIAEAMGKNVIWIDVFDYNTECGGGEVTKEPVQIEKYNGSSYMAEYGDMGEIYVNKVPNYSSSLGDIEEVENDLLTINRELLALIYSPIGLWTASYFSKKRGYIATVKSETQAHARALAIYECLTEKNWAEERNQPTISKHIE